MKTKKKAWINIATYDCSYIEMAENFQEVLIGFGVDVNIAIDDDMLIIELEAE